MSRSSAAAKVPSVLVYHNILWSKYKGVVFSSLNALADPSRLRFSFVQIAETETGRGALGGVDTRYHRYPYELLFAGRYDAIPTWRRTMILGAHLARSNADLVVLPGYHRIEYWAMWVLCLLLGKRRAVFCDSTKYDRPPGRIKAALKRIFFRGCDALFGYGRRSEEYMIENGAKPDAVYRGCQAAALPIDFDPATALAQRLASRKAAPEALFLYVGRLAPEKGLATLLTAFSQFRSRERRGRLKLVGAGPEQASLVALARQLQVEEFVEFAGAMDSEGLSRQYAQALCLVLPSTSEPWGLVVNEALHHGCPVIVSEICGCRPDLVLDGETGFAFPPNDADALCRRMQDLSRMSTDGERVALQCQQLIGNFTPQHAACRILQGCAHALRLPPQQGDR